MAIKKRGKDGLLNGLDQALDEAAVPASPDEKQAKSTSSVKTEKAIGGSIVLDKPRTLERKSERMSFALTPSLKARIQEAKARTGIPANDLIHQILDNFIDIVN